MSLFLIVLIQVGLILTVIEVRELVLKLRARARQAKIIADAFREAHGDGGVALFKELRKNKQIGIDGYPCKSDSCSIEQMNELFRKHIGMDMQEAFSAKIARMSILRSVIGMTGNDDDDSGGNENNVH
jgi:hypothetical protein